MASGVAMPWALKAQKMLKEEFDVLADIYSVTSWNELRRDGLEAERFNLLNNDEDAKVPFATELLKKHDGPIVAVSDWMKLVPEQLRPYLKQDFYTLGTDGWGVSDTRGALRRHFLVDAESIVIQSLISLVKNGEIKNKVVKEALNKYKLSDPSAADPGSLAGDS
jgi:pyruvate dehydrogenase E1 component